MHEFNFISFANFKLILAYRNGLTASLDGHRLTHTEIQLIIEFLPQKKL